MAFAYAGRYSPEAFVDPFGQPLRNTVVTVYNAGTVVLATLYADRGKNDTIVNPTATDSRGNCSFYAAPGYYDLLINGVTIQNVSVEADPADIESRAAGSEVIARSVLDQKGVILTATAAGSPTVLPPDTNGKVLSLDSDDDTGLGWISVETVHDALDHTGLPGVGTEGIQAAIDNHEAGTTDVHGIPDTAALATATTVTDAVAAHAGLADPHTVYQLESGFEATHDALDHTGLTGIGAGVAIPQQDEPPASPEEDDLWIDTDATANDYEPAGTVATHAADTSTHGFANGAALLDETAHDLLDHTGLTGVGGGGTEIPYQTDAPSSPSTGDVWIDSDETAPSGTSALLAVVAYRAGSDATKDITSTSFADFDATNLAVTFTAPASGKVLVRLSSTMDNNGADNSYWALRESTTTIGSQLMSFSTAIAVGATAVLYITGLTPGNSYTYKWAGKRSAGGTSTRLYNGPTWGPSTMEVWSAP